MARSHQWGEWVAAAEALSAKAQTELPTSDDVVAASQIVLNRRVSSSAMATAMQYSLNAGAEAHVPLGVVVGLSRMASDVRRAEYVRSFTNESAPEASEGDEAPQNPTGVRNHDRLYTVFDSAMRHVALASQRSARTSDYYSGLPPAREGDVPTRPLDVWEAAIAVMTHAHFCGVLQHEYDGPGENLRINATSRIWRNFAHAMCSEEVGEKPGRSAWENGLTLLAYMTPVPKRDSPPCCGFTTDDDEFAVIKAVEQTLGRAARRDELLSWHKWVRNDDVTVNRHVCGSKEVRAFAAARIRAMQQSSESRPLVRGTWGLEMDVCGDACIVNLLRTVAPNAVTHASSGEPTPVATSSVTSGMFFDREWNRSDEELNAIDAALSAGAAPPGESPS